MLLIMGGLSIAVGYQIEKKYGYITRLRNTKPGQYFLGSNMAILFTEMIILMILASLIKVLNIDANQFDIISGLVVGQLILIMLVANGLMKK
ncbi:MAG: hypothetical protein JEZ08_01585 [Clostridiales bacterium]|nr:hypothetical protein [Clostridiales bacterium]